MTVHQANIFWKRIQKIDQWERGISFFINIVFVLMAVFAKIQNDPVPLWVMSGMILLAISVLHKDFQKRKRRLLENNIVNFPQNWDQDVTKVSHFMYLRIIIIFGFIITYYIPSPWAYGVIAFIFITSWIIQIAEKRERLSIYKVFSEYKLRSKV